MIASIIVAASENDVIGKGGKLPWRLSADLAKFKKLTMGHPIIMGRKTFESIGRPLPGRRNIIITHNRDFFAEGCDITNSLDLALKIVSDQPEVFIIGGSSIYEQALPKADKIYLTRVKATIEGDKFFKFDDTQWKKTYSEVHPKDEKNQYTFEFQEWIRR